MVAKWSAPTTRARLASTAGSPSSRSSPMFRAQTVSSGSLFTEGRALVAVLSIWRDRTCAEALENSPFYRATVEAISSGGFLTGDRDVGILQPDGGHLLPASPTW